MLGQANGSPAFLLDGGLRIRQHFQHRVVQLRLVVQFAERFPASPAHRGVWIGLGKLDQARAHGAGQLRALIAERNGGSQAGGTMSEHGEPVRIFERAEVGCSFGRIKRPNVELGIAFRRYNGGSRETFDYGLKRRTGARIIGGDLLERGFYRRNRSRIAVHFQTQRSVLGIMLKPERQGLQDAIIANMQGRQHEGHITGLAGT